MCRSLRLIASLMLLPLLAACTAKSGGRSSENLSQTVNRHEQQIQGLMSQVGQVEQVLPGQAEMWSQMQSMRQELNQVHGQMSEMGVQLGGTGGTNLATMQEEIRRLQKAVRQMSSQLAINVGELEVSDQYGGVSPDAGMGATVPMQQPGYTPAPTPAPVATPNVAGDSSAAQNLYDSGIKAFDQRRYKDAVASFKGFVANYPNHNLASNAAFWQGECYFQLQDYARAALAYQDVLTKHPGSNKFQSSMLKQGISLYNAGKKQAGRERLQELVSRYPNSPETSRAKQFLAQNK